MRKPGFALMLVLGLAIGIAFGVWTQLRAKGAPEAPSGFDNQTIEVGTDPNNSQHLQDKKFFDEIEEAVPDGLGPVYNAQSCRECHQNPVSGGGSQILEQRAGHLNDEGKFE